MSISCPFPCTCPYARCPCPCHVHVAGFTYHVSPLRQYHQSATMRMCVSAKGCNRRDTRQRPATEVSRQKEKARDEALAVRERDGEEKHHEDRIAEGRACDLIQ